MEDNKNPQMNPWHPITDPLQLKLLGKLGEESGELTSAVLRCIIQGMNEKEPTTGKVNKKWLEQEIGDVLAGIEMVSAHYDLDHEFILERKHFKMQLLKQWHDMK